MKEMQIFENQEFGAVRTVELDGEPWLVGKDVAQALGYSDTDQALRKHVDEEDKKILTRQNDGLAGGSGNATFDIPNRGMTIINESGLYSLVLSSKLPGAKKFRRWVTAEVLPAVRKHGAYMTPHTLEQALLSPDFLLRLAQRLKEEQEGRRVAERDRALLA
ncbi:MAG: Bro-N domain-containing protein, partial [Flavonifractor plautii]